MKAYGEILDLAEKSLLSPALCRQWGTKTANVNPIMTAGDLNFSFDLRITTLLVVAGGFASLMLVNYVYSCLYELEPSYPIWHPALIAAGFTMVVALVVFRGDPSDNTKICEKFLADLKQFHLLCSADYLLTSDMNPKELGGLAQESFIKKVRLVRRAELGERQIKESKTADIKTNLKEQIEFTERLRQDMHEAFRVLEKFDFVSGGYEPFFEMAEKTIDPSDPTMPLMLEKTVKKREKR